MDDTNHFINKLSVKRNKVKLKRLTINSPMNDIMANKT